MRWQFQFVGPNNNLLLFFCGLPSDWGGTLDFSDCSLAVGDLSGGSGGEGNADNERGSARQHSIT